MASNIELDLCSDIILSHFGPIVLEVATLLLSRGRSNLKYITLQTKKPKSHIRDVLTILIQHNLVTYASNVERGRIVVYYEIVVANVLLRDRFANYVLFIKEILKNTASTVLETILLHGRLQPFDILNEIWKIRLLNSKQKETHLISPILDEDDKDDVESQKIAQRKLFEEVKSEVHTAVLDLLNWGFIVPVTKEEQNTLVDRQINEENDEIEKGGMILTATERKKLRARLNAQRTATEDDVPTGTKRKLLVTFEEIEEKEKNGEDINLMFDSDKSYKVNFVKFHIHFRNLEIIKYAEINVNGPASELVGVFITQVIDQMKRIKEDVSEPVSLSNFGIKITQSEPRVMLPMHGCTPTSGINPVYEYLQLMSHDDIPIFKRQDEMGGGKYVVRLKDMATKFRSEIIETIAMEKCGQVGKRVWRILKEKLKIDDKEIAKQAVVEEKEARTALYKLLQFGLVFMQDVPKTLDHSASRTIILWFVDINRTSEILLQNSYKTIHRLKIRHAYQLEKRKVLIEKANRTDILSGVGKLPANDLKLYEILKSECKQLVGQIQRLDQMVMKLRDF
ncbi:hypothetical protein BC833DRAFT_623575 [Globomyces pollinis-pini]|nr:hypothetical protein BC833DRAFT_623575 [Globomyces pollinis-pini]